MSRHASLLLLASAACVDGFAGPALMRQPPRTPARAHLSAPVMAFGLSFGGRSEEPAGPSEEAQALYRMLGVSEDATYDEIVDGYDALCAKYKGETKKLIKLQVAKDKILEDRLRQRMSGSMKPMYTTAPEDRKAPPRQLKLPPFMDDFAQLPTKGEVIENALVFGFIGLLPILSGAFAPTSVMIMTGVSIYKLYNRGAGRGPSNDMEMYQKTFKMKPFALTVAACLLSMGIGALLSQVLVGIIGIAEELLITLSVAFTLGTACSVFKLDESIY